MPLRKKQGRTITNYAEAKRVKRFEEWDKMTRNGGQQPPQSEPAVSPKAAAARTLPVPMPPVYPPVGENMATATVGAVSRGGGNSIGSGMGGGGDMAILAQAAAAAANGAPIASVLAPLSIMPRYRAAETLYPGAGAQSAPAPEGSLRRSRRAKRSYSETDSRDDASSPSGNGSSAPLDSEMSAAIHSIDPVAARVWQRARGQATLAAAVAEEAAASAQVGLVGGSTMPGGYGGSSSVVERGIMSRLEADIAAQETALHRQQKLLEARKEALQRALSVANMPPAPVTDNTMTAQPKQQTRRSAAGPLAQPPSLAPPSAAPAPQPPSSTASMMGKGTAQPQSAAYSAVAYPQLYSHAPAGPYLGMSSSFYGMAPAADTISGPQHAQFRAATHANRAGSFTGSETMLLPMHLSYRVPSTAGMTAAATSGRHFPSSAAALSAAPSPSFSSAPGLAHGGPLNAGPRQSSLSSTLVPADHHPRGGHSFLAINSEGQGSAAPGVSSDLPHLQNVGRERLITGNEAATTIVPGAASEPTSAPWAATTSTAGAVASRLPTAHMPEGAPSSLSGFAPPAHAAASLAQLAGSPMGQQRFR